MTRKSSSLHTISADNGINFLLKPFFRLFNNINNLSSYDHPEEHLKTTNFISPNIDKYWDEISYDASPSRRLSELFLLELPWDKIKNELENINIYDIGCGIGRYGPYLNKWSKNRINFYHGVDIRQYDNWNEVAANHSNILLTTINNSFSSDIIPDETNFFFTIGSMEHIVNDFLYFKEIGEFIKSKKRSIIQVHLLPTPSKFMKLFRYHGIRQYSPRTLSKISNIFREYSECTLYRLGGPHCIDIHWNYITKPLIKNKAQLHKSNTKEYNQKLYSAIKEDFSNNSNDASFYAFVVHSFPKKSIFGA